MKYDKIDKLNYCEYTIKIKVIKNMIVKYYLLNNSI